MYLCMIVLIIYKMYTAVGDLFILFSNSYQELGASTAEEVTATDKQAQKTAQGSDL